MLSHNVDIAALLTLSLLIDTRNICRVSIMDVCVITLFDLFESVVMLTSCALKPRPVAMAVIDFYNRMTLEWICTGHFVCDVALEEGNL